MLLGFKYPSNFTLWMNACNCHGYFAQRSIPPDRILRKSLNAMRDCRVDILANVVVNRSHTCICWTTNIWMKYYVHTCIHTSTHIYQTICTKPNKTHVHIHMYVLHVYVYLHNVSITCVCVCTNLYISTHTYIHACAYIYIYIYVQIHICMWVYVYTYVYNVFAWGHV